MKKPGEHVDYENRKEFTDREEARAVFWEWYEKSQTNLDDFFVLSYYGIGGIGKSWLLEQLGHELTEKSGIYVKYDFDDAKGLDPFNIIIGIKKTIRNKYPDRFHFPLLNTALIMLAKISDTDFVNDEIIKSIVVESPYLQGFVDAIALLPVVGGYIQNIIKLTSQLYADIDNLKINAQLKREYKKLINEMSGLQANELRSKMTQYFCFDMNTNVTDLSKPLVIFIDTYERYINTYKAASNVVLDSWLRESTYSLIQRVPGILWVISGRDRLTWGDNGEWDEYHLKPFEVIDFQPKDSKLYLRSAGLIDDELIEYISELTKGVPIYLDLCVDTYYLLKDKGSIPCINDFKVDQSRIVNRFVKYLDSVNQDIVFMLAAMQSWTEDEALFVGKNVTTLVFSIERYIPMVKHSFFIKDENGKTRMHSVVVNALLSEIQNCTINDVNGILFKYRMNKMDGGSIDFSDVIPLINDATEAFCRITKKDNYKEQYDDYIKLINKIKEARKQGYKNEGLRISTMLNKHCLRAFYNTGYCCESLLLQADFLREVNEYQEAMANDQIAYSISVNNFGKDNLTTLKCLFSLGADYESMGNYEEALKNFKQTYKMCCKVLGADHADTLRSLHSIGVNHSNLGHYKMALDTFRYTYDKRSKTLGITDPDTLSTLHFIGKTYDILGNTIKALEVFEQTRIDDPFYMEMLILNHIAESFHLSICLKDESKDYKKNKNIEYLQMDGKQLTLSADEVLDYSIFEVILTVWANVYKPEISENCKKHLEEVIINKQVKRDDVFGNGMDIIWELQVPDRALVQAYEMFWVAWTFMAGHKIFRVLGNESLSVRDEIFRADRFGFQLIIKFIEEKKAGILTKALDLFYEEYYLVPCMLMYIFGAVDRLRKMPIEYKKNYDYPSPEERMVAIIDLFDTDIPDDFDTENGNAFLNVFLDQFDELMD